MCNPSIGGGVEWIWTWFAVFGQNFQYLPPRRQCYEVCDAILGGVGKQLLEVWDGRMQHCLPFLLRSAIVGGVAKQMWEVCMVYNYEVHGPHTSHNALRMQLLEVWSANVGGSRKQLWDVWSFKPPTLPYMCTPRVHTHARNFLWGIAIALEPQNNRILQWSS